MEVAKLIKILNLTQSDSDGEALTALRMANNMLKKHGKTWEQVISSTPTQVQNNYRASHYEDVVRKYNAGPSGFAEHLRKMKEEMNRRAQKQQERNFYDFWGEGIKPPKEDLKEEGSSDYHKKESSRSGWSKMKNGNYIHYVTKTIVFQKYGSWCWVYKGEFGPKFIYATEAMDDWTRQHG